MSGWICSYRKIWDHPIFAGSAERVGVWTWILHTAAWKPTRFRIGSSLVELQRGQLCISQRQVEEQTGMGRQKLRTFLKELESEGAITQDLTQGRSIITICKYEDYQEKKKLPNPSANPELTQSQPTKEQDKQLNNIPVGEAEASRPIEFSILAKTVFDTGIRILCPYGSTEKEARALVGRWRKSATDTEILAAFDACHKNGTQDPIPYITEILKPAQAQPSIADIAARAKREGKI